MKKAKKLGLQSLALVLMAFVLVAGVAFGMTGAWFTDKDETAGQTMTMGKRVDVGFEEVAFAAGTWNQNGTTGSGYYFPGDVVALTGSLDAKASAEALLRIKVTITDSNGLIAKGATLTVDAQQGSNTVEHLVTDGATTSWIYLAHTLKDAETYELTGTLTLTGTALTNSAANLGLSIKFEVQAIQKANVKVDNGVWKTDTETPVAIGEDTLEFEQVANAQGLYANSTSTTVVA